MDRKKIYRLEGRISKLRKKVGNIYSRELENLACSLGRTRDKRGKEPTYISTELSDARPVSIPNHPGSLNKFTAGNILDQFEQDLVMLKEKVDRGGG